MTDDDKSSPRIAELLAKIKRQPRRRIGKQDRRAFCEFYLATPWLPVPQHFAHDIMREYIKFVPKRPQPRSVVGWFVHCQRIVEGKTVDQACRLAEDVFDMSESAVIKAYKRYRRGTK